MDIDNDYGENKDGGSAPVTPRPQAELKVVLEHEDDIEEESSDEDVEQKTERVLERAGVIREGQVIEAPPSMTPSQQQAKYKRKMTEKRLEALKKAREAKKLKREKMLKERAPAPTPAAPKQRKMKDGALPRYPRPQAELKVAKPRQTPVSSETEDERIERLVQARLAKASQKTAPPKETEEQRIDRLVQEKLKSYTPAKPSIDPLIQARKEREDYFSRLIFGS